MQKVLLLCSGFVLVWGCSSNPSCADTATCSTGGGSSSVDGGAGEAGTSAGGMSQAAASVPTAGQGGKADGCREDCTGELRQCDESSGNCVECLTDSHCGTEKRHCSPRHTCVACLTASNCTESANAACVADACVPCRQDDDCQSQGEKAVCASGSCVVCSVNDESACGANSCNPATGACTGTLRSSKSSCEVCVADSDCVGSSELVPPLRCLAMQFNGAPHGNYCLPVLSTGARCSQPFLPISVSTVSQSNVAVAAYCSPEQALATCEAVLDLVKSVPCTVAADCGCPRDSSGACLSAGQGGRCETVAGVEHRCTYTCGVTDACTTNRTCGFSPSNYCR